MTAISDCALVQSEKDYYYGYLDNKYYKFDQNFNLIETQNINFAFFKNAMFYSLKFGDNFFTVNQNRMIYFNLKQILSIKPLDNEHQINMLNFTYSQGQIIFKSNKTFYLYSPHSNLITEKNIETEHDANVKGLHSYCNELFIITSNQIYNQSNGFTYDLKPQTELLHKYDNILLFKDQNNKIMCFDIISKTFVGMKFTHWTITQQKQRIFNNTLSQIEIKRNTIFVRDQIISQSDNLYQVYEFQTSPDPYNKELCFKQKILENVELNQVYSQLNKMIQNFRDEIEEVIQSKVQELKEKEEELAGYKKIMEQECQKIAISNQLVQISNSKLMNQYIHMIRRQEYTKMVQDGLIDFEIQ